jgi:glucose-1-phosphatase
MMFDHHEAQALLFDLGGVVIAIDWERVFERWAQHSPLSPDEIYGRFRMDKAYEQHERGELSESEYFAHLRPLLEFEGDDEALRSGWNAVFAGEIKETVQVLQRLRPKIPLYLFSNSNPTHEAFWKRAYSDTVGLFTQVFVSSTLGHRKPEQAAFEAVASATGIELKSMLFFDDTRENIEGARAAGLQAVLVTGPDDISHALSRYTGLA